MLRNILTPPVPALAADHAERVLDDVLARAGLVRGDIAAWIMHAGGRDVLLGASSAARARRGGAVRYSAAMLREYGNLSAAPFVYFVLAGGAARRRAAAAGGGCRRSARASAATARCSTWRERRRALCQRRVEPEMARPRCPPDDPAAQRARAATCGASTRFMAHAPHRWATALRRAASAGAGRDRIARDRRGDGCADARASRAIAARRWREVDARRCSTGSRSSRRDDRCRCAAHGVGGAPTAIGGRIRLARRSRLARDAMSIVANLFLHHFDGAALAPAARRLVPRRADALVACEPRRSSLRARPARTCSAFSAANDVTRHDARAQRARRLRGEELSELAGGRRPAIGELRALAVDEYDDGLFTPCFSPSRRRAGR